MIGLFRKRVTSGHNVAASAAAIAMVLTMTLAVAPASATVPVSSSNPGNWWQNDSSTQPSHRCVYHDDGYEAILLKLKVWPPHAQAKTSGTTMRWHFVARRGTDYPPSNPSTVYTSPWQTQTRPVGSWATAFTPQTWNVPSSMADDNYLFSVRVEIQWRNGATTTGSVKYQLEYFRQMMTYVSDEVYQSPCYGEFVYA